jgi:hypothetical protein
MGLGQCDRSSGTALHSSSPARLPRLQYQAAVPPCSRSTHLQREREVPQHWGQPSAVNGGHCFILYAPHRGPALGGRRAALRDGGRLLFQRGVMQQALHCNRSKRWECVGAGVSASEV